MKNLRTYINEDFKISKNTNIKRKIMTPLTLRNLIVERYKENSEHIDMSDIDVSELRNFCFGTMEEITYGLFANLSQVKTIDIRGWNTSSAIKMTEMFSGCIELEKIKGIENFDVSNVKNMSRMFEGCIKLNVDLSAWKPNYNKLERVTDMFNGTKIEYPRWYAEYILLR